MSLWKITDKGPRKVPETRFAREQLLEEHLERWIEADSSVLGEPLLIIGRQVLIPDVKDRLDLLAVDPQGAAVIIELKRGELKDPVDIQALRYASYISKWQFEDFESVAKNYLGKGGHPDFNFNAMFETFCVQSGIEEIPDLNSEQRIIIVGSSVRDKLGSVALWLRSHNVDVKLIEVQAFKERGQVLIQPTVIVPLPVRFEKVGKGPGGSTPWMTDGRNWHLEKRCGPAAKELALTIDKLLQDNFDVDGPKWGQKYYFSYSVDGRNWLFVQTRPKSIWLDFRVKAKTFSANQLAKELAIVKFDKEDSLVEKLALPSSVYVKSQNENTDRVRIRVKEDFNLKSKVFIKFLNAAYKACTT